VFPSPVSVAGADVLGGWHSVAAATLEEALGVTDGDAGARLRDLAEAARSAFEGFGRVDRTPVMRIHGDLHVGQVLRAPDGPLLVGDFDGNPLLPAAARNAPHAAARDVASMACAIDHVGRVVTRLQPAATQAIGAWIERSRDAFLTAYRDALGDRSEVFEERLLGAFAVAQEAHEFVYAARYLPRWRYVPDAAMPAVLAWAAAA
jgi:maltokinase